MFTSSLRNSVLAVAILTACSIPAQAFADDLDDVLDDLIQYQEGRRAAAAAAEALETKLAARADESIVAKPQAEVPGKLERTSERKQQPAARREFKRASLRSM